MSETARYKEKVNRWSIREGYITLLTSTSVLFSESNFYKVFFLRFFGIESAAVMHYKCI